MSNGVERYEHHDYAPGRGDRIYREPQTDLAVADPTGGRLISWAQAMHAAKQLGDALSNTSFVPQVFRGKPDDAAAAIMYGDEIGFTPGQSLQNIYVIGGKPSLYARAMVALVMSQGHEVWTEASSPQRVIVCGKRRGSQHVERVEWTQNKAQQAGYTTNKKYQTDPEAMLYARASGDVARRIAPDALAGIGYTVEELELNEGAATTTVTASQVEQPKRTAQRASAKQAGEEPSLDDATPKAESIRMVTDGQKTKIGILLRELGITDRSEAVHKVSLVIGREIKSRTELTLDEAHNTIEALEAEKAAMEEFAREGDPTPGPAGDPAPAETQEDGQ